MAAIAGPFRPSMRTRITERAADPRNRKNGMKVRIERNDDPTGSSRMLENVGIRRSGHPDLAHMRTVNAGVAELLSRIPWQSLVEQNGEL